MMKDRAIAAALFLFAGCFWLGVHPAGFALAQTGSPIAINVTPKVTYGKGKVTRNGKRVERNLWMDVYIPGGKTTKVRPAVIMTFGGAFHRGNPRDSFEEAGARDTAMGDYCRKFAARGYACFAIDYRLAPEGPVPSLSGYSESDVSVDSLNTILPQVNFIRGRMKLKPLDLKVSAERAVAVNMVLSAAEDLRSAVDHIRKSAKRYNVDPSRLALGGFSAGGVTTLNAAHGLRVPVAGAFLLSGINVGLNIPRLVTETSKSPPVLMFLGQNDLPDGIAQMPKLLAHYRKVGIDHTFAWVPGFGHFYPAGATSLAGDGSKMSVENRIVGFLEKTIGKP